jgi:hypothetical protein
MANRTLSSIFSSSASNREKGQEDGESPSQSLVHIRAITTKTIRKSVATNLLLQAWQQITVAWKTDIITISAVSLVMKFYTM